MVFAVLAVADADVSDGGEVDDVEVEVDGDDDEVEVEVDVEVEEDGERKSVCGVGCSRDRCGGAAGRAESGKKGDAEAKVGRDGGVDRCVERRGGRSCSPYIAADEVSGSGTGGIGDGAQAWGGWATAAGSGG